MVKAAPGRFRSELHERLVNPLYPLAFMAIAGQLLRIDVTRPVEDVNAELARHQDRIPRPDIVDRNGNVLAGKIISETASRLATQQHFLVEKGLITDEEANTMDERQSYNLVFLPGFSMASQVSDVSGRGVGMDVVRTNIQKLNGSIEIRSTMGKGTTFIISLPLTLAILPVLLVRLGDQPFAVPLSMVREILPIMPAEVQEVGGKATMVVRGEVLPIMPLSTLLGWEQTQTPEYGVLMQSAEQSFILAIDSFAGREDAVIKSLDDFRPKGVAGVTTLSNGQIVLILDMKELLGAMGDTRGVSRRVLLAQLSMPALAA